MILFLVMESGRSKLSILLDLEGFRWSVDFPGFADWQSALCRLSLPCGREPSSSSPCVHHPHRHRAMRFTFRV